MEKKVKVVFKKYVKHCVETKTNPTDTPKLEFDQHTKTNPTDTSKLEFDQHTKTNLTNTPKLETALVVLC